jgi:hypothetical protein
MLSAILFDPGITVKVELITHPLFLWLFKTQKRATALTIPGSDATSPGQHHSLAPLRKSYTSLTLFFPDSSCSLISRVEGTQLVP